MGVGAPGERRGAGGGHAEDSDAHVTTPLSERARPGVAGATLPDVVRRPQPIYDGSGLCQAARMGLFGGDDDDVDAAVREVEASLPDGWRLKRVKHQLVGRRPVKHDTYGAVAKGPGGKVAAFS